MNTSSFYKRIATFLLLSGLVCQLLAPSAIAAKTDRDALGIRGPVHTLTERQTCEGCSNAFVVSRRYSQEGYEIETISGSESHGVTAALKFLYKRDAQGNKTSETVLRADGSTQHTVSYYYNSEGNKLFEVSYKGDGMFNFLRLYAYDRKGNWIEETSYGVLIPFSRLRAVREYDSSGKQIEATIYQRGGTKMVERYDPEGRLIQALAHDSDGALKSRTEYRYDTQGNEVESLTYKPDGSLAIRSVISYESDSMGNWIKRIAKRFVTNGASKPETELTTRVITYF